MKKVLFAGFIIGLAFGICLIIKTAKIETCKEGFMLSFAGSEWLYETAQAETENIKAYSARCQWIQ